MESDPIGLTPLVRFRDIHNSTENQLFIRNLLSLARTFGLVTIAECVENADDAAYLRDQGVDLLQGYYFGKPNVARPWTQGPGKIVEVAPTADLTRRAPAPVAKKTVS
jgi:EAL domain-containing protein (putative c-di-GMP-specific phosphodiesterase class I)